MPLSLPVALLQWGRGTGTPWHTPREQRAGREHLHPPQPSYGEAGPAYRLHTCGALHNQRGDGWLDGRDSDRGDQADTPHGHGAEDGARLSGGPL